jgi:hypothetical protein
MPELFIITALENLTSCTVYSYITKRRHGIWHVAAVITWDAAQCVTDKESLACFVIK